MTKLETNFPSADRRTAVLVMNAGATMLLCPFFDNCDGVLFDAADGSRTFHARGRSRQTTVCDLLLRLKPGRIICGFVSEDDKARLYAAGIDVRLGSCTCSVDELIDSFESLPRA